MGLRRYTFIYVFIYTSDMLVESEEGDEEVIAIVVYIVYKVVEL